MCERCKAPQRTRQRAGSDIAPLVGLRGQARYALEKRARLFTRKSVHSRIKVALIDRDHLHGRLRVWCVGLAKEPLSVANHRHPILFIGRHPVQHNHER